MNVVSITYVDDSGHADIVQVERLGLCFTQEGPFAIGLQVIMLQVIGKLDHIEGHIRIVPSVAPVGNKRLQEALVLRRTPHVITPLVPDTPLNGEMDERIHHAIIEHGRIIGVVFRTLYGDALWSQFRTVVANTVFPFARESDIAPDAAFGTRVLNAADEEVLPLPDETAWHHVITMCHPSVGLAHTDSVPPADIIIVDDTHIEFQILSCLLSGDDNLASHPERTVERPKLSSPEPRHSNRFPGRVVDILLKPGNTFV